MRATYLRVRADGLPRLNRRGGFADYGIGGWHGPQRTRARRGRRSKSWLSFRAALALSFVASLLAIAQPAHAEKRVALVIGNNDYKNVPKLQKAVNDARAMHNTLKQLQFCVIVSEI